MIINTPAPNSLTNQYVGLWVTADRRIRQRLMTNGRYVEARGSRENAYSGSYQIRGDYITYQDDSGFEADGEFREDVLYHAGMIMYRDDETN